MLDVLWLSSLLVGFCSDVSSPHEFLQNWIDGTGSGPPDALCLSLDLLQEIVSVSGSRRNPMEDVEA